MSYRFYTSREFARLRAIKEREEQRRLKAIVVQRMPSPLQTELCSLLHLVPDDRQMMARMWMRLKNPSPKQMAAMLRWVNRAKGIPA